MVVGVALLLTSRMKITRQTLGIGEVLYLFKNLVIKDCRTNEYHHAANHNLNMYQEFSVLPRYYLVSCHQATHPVYTSTGASKPGSRTYY